MTTETMTVPNGIYTEATAPKDSQVIAFPLQISTPYNPEVDILANIYSLKYGIFKSAYPQRPLPRTCSLHIGVIDGEYSGFLECYLSPPMNMGEENVCSWFNRQWMFTNASETLKVAEELLSCLDEIFKIGREVK